MTRLAGSVSATQPPLDVLANELFHQFGPVGLQKAAKRFLQHLVAAVEPSLLHKGVNLAMQPLRDFGLNGFHDVRPTWLPVSTRKLMGRFPGWSCAAGDSSRGTRPIAPRPLPRTRPNGECLHPRAALRTRPRE